MKLCADGSEGDDGSSTTLGKVPVGLTGEIAPNGRFVFCN